MRSKYRFERLYAFNRWKLSKWSRSDNWVIIGVFKWWSGPGSFCYMVGLFGFEIRFWFKEKEVKNDQK